MSLPAGALIRDRTHPERGYGRVMDTDEEGFARVRWPDGSVGAMRLVEQDELVHARLQAGQRVRLVSEPAGEPPSEEPPAPEALPEGTIVEAAASEPLRSYVVALGEEQQVLPESALEPLQAAVDDPVAALESLAWEGAPAFAARLGFLRALSRWFEDGFGIPAFLGARIVPLPHQIHAARRVLTDRAPRFVLADEVGLGKTIEAGLVLQALAAADANLRVLVIAPGAMSRQWLCELFLRFGEQVFTHVDASRLGGHDDAGLLSAPRLIVSTGALEAAPSAREQLLAQRWDVLVVDEAHQIHPDAGLYAFVRELASRSWGMLALSATPAKGDTRGLLGLLGLVAPAAYDPAHPERFEADLARRDEVAAWLDAALGELEQAREAGGALSGERIAARAGELGELLREDPHVAAAAARLVDEPDAEELADVLAHVQEFHRVDRRIVRTRRATVRALGTRLCERQLTTLDYEPTPGELALLHHVEALPDAPQGAPLQLALHGLYLRRALTSPLPLLALFERRRAALQAGIPASDFDPLAALGTDPGPAEEEHLLERVLREAPPLAGEAAWLEEAIQRTHAWMAESPSGCARVQAALRWLSRERRRGKVLVFAQDREVVEALAETLRDDLGPDVVGAIHHGLAEVQLSEIALRFQQPQGPCRVLISDELGGEGRNFQVASAVLHFDQPWAVGRLEQRIGRLDRIGRRADRPVRSAVLLGPSPSERGLFALHADVLEVYRRSLGGLEFLLPQVQRETTRAVCTGAAALEALRGPMAERVARERAQADQAYDRSLDASARQLEEASEQAEVLVEVDLEQDVDVIAAWAERIGLSFKPMSDQVWSLGWSWEHLRRLPAGLAPPERVPVEGRVRKRGTFSRDVALGDESLEYFAPGHPVLDALVRDLLGQREGRAAALTRNLGPDHRGKAYLLVAARTRFPKSADDLPPGLRYRAQSHLWPSLRLATLRLRPGQPEPVEPVKDRALQRQLEAPDSSDQTLDPDVLARSVDLPALWQATRQGVEQALATIHAERQREVEDAARRLGEELGEDLAFLRGALTQANSDEVRAALSADMEARERLLAAVRGEELEVAALALVVGV